MCFSVYRSFLLTAVNLSPFFSPFCKFPSAVLLEAASSREPVEDWWLEAVAGSAGQRETGREKITGGFIFWGPKVNSSRQSNVCVSLCVFVMCLVAGSCPTLCHPMDYSPSGFSVHGIFQARILEWVAISSSRESSGPRDWTRASYLCIGRRVLYHWPPLGSPSSSQIYFSAPVIFF